MFVIEGQWKRKLVLNTLNDERNWIIDYMRIVVMSSLEPGGVGCGLDLPSHASLT